MPAFEGIRCHGIEACRHASGEFPDFLQIARSELLLLPSCRTSHLSPPNFRSPSGPFLTPPHAHFRFFRRHSFKRSTFKMRPSSFLLSAAVAVASVSAAIIPKHARRCVVICFDRYRRDVPDLRGAEPTCATDTPNCVVGAMVTSPSWEVSNGIFEGSSLEADSCVPDKRTTRLRSAKIPWLVSILRCCLALRYIYNVLSGSGSGDRHSLPAETRCSLAPSASSRVSIPYLSNLGSSKTIVL